MPTFMRNLVRQGRRHNRRAISTSPVVQNASQSFTLPPTRLRALISLYHQSSSFITPANLSDRIDHAFTDPKTVPQLKMATSSRAELQERVRTRRSANEVGAGRPIWRGVPLEYKPGRMWSDKRGPRQSQVSAALWGTELDGKPALETIEETTHADEELNNRLAEVERPHTRSH